MPRFNEAIIAALVAASSADTVTVHTSDLKATMREYQKFARELGILGYDENGRVIVTPLRAAQWCREQYELMNTWDRKVSSIETNIGPSGILVTATFMDNIKHSQLYTWPTIESRSTMLVQYADR